MRCRGQWWDGMSMRCPEGGNGRVEPFKTISRDVLSLCSPKQKAIMGTYVCL